MSAKVEENVVADSRVHQRIGQLITALMEDERVGSSRELGRLTGIAFNTLANWCEGKADPRLQKLMQFAYAIGWSMTELMQYAEGDEDPYEAIARKKKSTTTEVSQSVVTSEEDPFIEYFNATLTSEQIHKRDLFLQRIKADLLPDILCRKRLYVLLIDSMAVQGISELNIFEKTSISEKLLSKIRNIDMEFQLGHSYLEQLAPYLFQVKDWEKLRPIFKIPYTSYEGDIDSLIEDLQ